MTEPTAKPTVKLNSRSGVSASTINEDNINKVFIYDISGKLVLKNRIELPDQISISNLSNGLYFLSIGRDGHFARKSFVVSR